MAENQRIVYTASGKARGIDFDTITQIDMIKGLRNSEIYISALEKWVCFANSDGEIIVYDIDAKHKLVLLIRSVYNAESPDNGDIVRDGNGYKAAAA